MINCLDIINSMKPIKWTQQAVYQATRIFVSNLSIKILSHYFKIVLLPKIIKNIQENHYLDPLIKISLKKASFKPPAFYNGIIIPVCKSKTSNKREAIILSSVLIRLSLPKVHSIMFLLQLMKFKYIGIQIYFIKALLMKNYILPQDVITSLVNYFLSFRTEPKKLPVV